MKNIKDNLRYQWSI